MWTGLGYMLDLLQKGGGRGVELLKMLNSFVDVSRLSVEERAKIVRLERARRLETVV